MNCPPSDQPWVGVEDVFMTHWDAKCSDLRIKLRATDLILDQMRISVMAVARHEANVASLPNEPAP